MTRKLLNDRSRYSCEIRREASSRAAFVTKAATAAAAAAAATFVCFEIFYFSVLKFC